MSATRLLTYSEAGEQLGVTGEVVRRMARKGEIARVILSPRKQRIHPDDLAALIARSRHGK